MAAERPVQRMEAVSRAVEARASRVTRPTRRVFFVSPNGSDENSGRRKRAPWRTVQRAMDRAPAGATVYLRDGRYAAGLNVMRRSGRRGRPITFTNYGRERVIIANQIKVTGSASWLRFRGLTIQSARPRSGGGYGFFVVGTARSMIHDISITRCLLRDNRGGGVYADFVSGIVIRRCKIVDNGRATARGGIGHGLYLGGAHGVRNVTVAHNLIRHNLYGRGIQLYQEADDVRIVCNRVVNNSHRNETGGPGIQIAGGPSRATDHAVVRHNIVARNENGGIGFHWQGPAGRGNIVSSNRAWGNTSFQFEKGGHISWRKNVISRRMQFPPAWSC